LNGWKAKLEVVPLGKWKRNQWYDEAGWTFIPPSPNIRTLTGALLYVGIGCFEATNVSVGRGTDMPFEIFGAPWMDGAAVCAYLRTQKFQGAVFEPVTFVPTEDLYKGETCHGVRIRITNRNTIRPYALFTSAFFTIAKNEKEFKPDWGEIEIVTGTSMLKNFSEEGRPYLEYLERVQGKLDEFVSRIKSFKLYP
jgi:uncharacterized protein YbbC (DUF1343 family)